MRCPCLECDRLEHDKRTLACVLCEKRLAFDYYIRAYFTGPAAIDPTCIYLRGSRHALYEESAI
jgi:hypothetical protein